jgi:NADH-quinone oxidoreductase subunit J
MIVTAIFGFLALIAVLGAGGVLLYRRPLACGLSFLLCCTALAGLYLLLNTWFLAAVQLVVGVFLTGTVIAICIPVLGIDTRQGRSYVRPHRTLWYVPAGLAFLALAYWGITEGTLGEPVISSPPVWAVRGEHVPALGRELITRYLVPFTLLGLLLFVSIVSVAYLIRQDQHPRTKEGSK